MKFIFLFLISSTAVAQVTPSEPAKLLWEDLNVNQKRVRLYLCADGCDKVPTEKQEACKIKCESVPKWLLDLKKEELKNTGKITFF